MEQLVYNAIRTPDGTVIESHSRHDYITHTDANGKEYMVDGGNDYIRCSANGDEEDLSVTIEDGHEKVREVYTWGTYGKEGTDPFKRVALKDLTKNHINAILKTQAQIPRWTRYMFEFELAYRKVLDK